MTEEQGDVVPSSPDIHFEPIVRLPLVETKTLEEDEDVLFKMRAKLYRYDSEDDPAQWKERGIGDVKILKHKAEDTCRILMRRDKTLKICANHYLQPYMELKPNSTSDKAWVWSTMADFADEEPKPELLAIKFASVENALKFKKAFDDAKSVSYKGDKQEADQSKSEKDDESSEDESPEKDESEKDDKSSESKSPEKVAEKLSNLTVADDKKDSDVTKEENTDKASE